MPLEVGDYRVTEKFDTFDAQNELITISKDKLLEVLHVGEFEGIEYMVANYQGIVVEIHDEDYSKLVRT